MKNLFTSLLAMSIRLVCMVSKKCRRGMHHVKALPHTSACALQHPRMQYQVAFLLATILALLLGWPLFVSTLAHASLADIGQR